MNLFPYTGKIAYRKKEQREITTKTGNIYTMNIKRLVLFETGFNAVNMRSCA
jgi:hypothetical protein